MKILLLTKYDSLGPSSRVRILQYIPYFISQNFHVSSQYLLPNEYIKALYNHNILSKYYLYIKGLINRLIFLFRRSNYDVIIIEKEIFDFTPYFIESLFIRKNERYFLDYDDAVFLRYNHIPLLRNKYQLLVKNSSGVFCGNRWLQEYSSNLGSKNSIYIPTSIIPQKYNIDIKTSFVANKSLVVGWIGNPLTFKTYILDSELLKIFNKLKLEFDITFIAIGARYDQSLGTPFKVLQWSEKEEVNSINKFDIGIMPLNGSEWDKGKCGYKLIQYMALSKTVVASKFGANVDIIENAKTGFLVKTPNEWYDCLKKLYYNTRLLSVIGKNAMEQVSKYFTTEVQSEKIIKAISKQKNNRF